MGEPQVRSVSRWQRRKDKTKSKKAAARQAAGAPAAMAEATGVRRPSPPQRARSPGRPAAAEATPRVQFGGAEQLDFDPQAPVRPRSPAGRNRDTRPEPRSVRLRSPTPHPNGHARSAPKGGHDRRRDKGRGKGGGRPRGRR